jgi:hypothetical protein
MVSCLGFFLVEAGPGPGPKHRESKMTVLCLLIIIILISYIIIYCIIIKLLIMENHPSQNRKQNSRLGYLHLISSLSPLANTLFIGILIGHELKFLPGKVHDHLIHNLCIASSPKSSYLSHSQLVSC